MTQATEHIDVPDHHRDGKPWDPDRYNPDNSDTWKCNGLNADCGYSHAVRITN